MQIENITPEDANKLQGLVSELSKGNPHIRSKFYTVLSDSERLVNIEDSVNKLRTEVEEIRNMISRAVGDHVLIAGRWTDIRRGVLRRIKRK